MSGWIKIDRKIFDHWLYRDPWKFRNWIDLIGLANFEEHKLEIGGEIFLCKRGQSLRSLQTLANRWKCDKSKVRRFLKLLERDDMIRIENVKKTTRITICNYDSYQIERNDHETKVKRKRNANETQTNPNKKEKNIRKKEFQDQLNPYLEKYGKDLLNEFYLYWTEDTPKGRLRYEEQKAFSLERRLLTWDKNSQKFGHDSGDNLMNHINKQLNDNKKRNLD